MAEKDRDGTCSDHDWDVMELLICILALWLTAATLVCLLIAGAAQGDAKAARQLASCRRAAPVRPRRGSVGSAAR